MNRKGNAALLLSGCVLVALFVALGLTRDSATPGPGSVYIAVVRDVPDGKGNISKAQFDRAMLHAAAAAGLKDVPPSVDPRYASLQRAAVDDLLQAAWLTGEAAESGITVSDAEVAAQLNAVSGGQSGGGSGLAKYLKSTNFTLDELKARLRLQLISQKVQDKVARTVTGSDVKKYQQRTEGSANGPRSPRQLVQEAQQARMKAFIKSYNAKWIPRTYCAVDYQTSFCGNYRDDAGSRNAGQAASQPAP